MAISLCTVAQSGTNSPYSQYGLGVQSDQTTGFNRGMNGLGIAFREHNQVNTINPASYSAVDSLTFLFDVGFSGQVTNFKEGNRKLNANNADFEYAVAAFRLARNFGLSCRILILAITIPQQARPQVLPPPPMPTATMARVDFTRRT